MVNPDLLRSPPPPDDTPPNPEAVFRALLEHSPDVVTLIGADGLIRYESPSVERVLGYRPEELHGLPAWHLVHPDDLEGVRRAFGEAAEAGAPFRASYRARHRDGSWRVLESVGTRPLGDPGIEGVIVSSRDVTERVRAEADLQTSAETLRAIVEAAPEAVIAIDTRGDVTIWNPAAERIFGWSADEVIGGPLPIVPEDAREEHLRFREQVLVRGEAFSDVEVVRRRRDGSLVPVSLSTAPMRDARGRILGVVSLSADISEQRRAAAALRESQHLFRNVVDTLGEGILITDLDDRILYTNARNLEITGFSAEELLGRKSSEVLLPQHERGRFDHRMEERAGGRAESYEMQQLRKDGSLIWVEVHGSPLRDAGGEIIGTIGAVSDVTERKAAEETHRRLAALVESSSDAILSTSLDGTILSWNKAAERIYGYAAEELVGRSISVLIPPELASDEAATVFRLARGERIETHETVRLCKDGRRIHVSLTVSPILNDAGEIVSVSSIARDISEAKRAEAELRASKEAAEAASRSKSEFLSGMSHELRTPLNSVIGFTNVLRKNRAANLREQELGYLERIHANGMHLLGLINDILDLSKIEAGKMKVELAPVALDALVRETLEELQGNVPRSVELRSEVPDSTALLETDARKLKQILINLVGNALKFTEAGSVTARVEVESSTRRPVRIDIADTGVGIAEDRLRAIFEAFEQGEAGTTRRFGGTGLGLAISSSLAHLLGYRVAVRSEVGVGSTFSVLLAEPAERPAAPPEPSAEHAALEEILAEAEPGEFRDRLVLVIDDDADSRFVLSEAIAEHGCEILVASSGEQGVELAREIRPDLITLDLIMPGGMSGWDTLQALKSDPSLCGIPVVVISVLAEESRGGISGAVDLLPKPPSRSELQGVLRRNLGARPGRVLVVDDDEETRLAIAACVQEEGVEIRTAGNGREALNVLRTFTPDLLFLDLLMPEMDGAELLTYLRENRPDLHPSIVVVTGKALTPAERDRLRREASAVIRKDEDLVPALRRELQEVWRRGA